MRRLTHDLRERGITVQEAWSRPEPSRLDGVVYPLVYPVTSRGLPVPGALLPALRGAVRLLFGLVRLRPHIVNVHFLQPELLYFLWFRRLLRYRIVLSLHGSDVLSPWHGRAVRRYAARADVVTAVTPALADAVAVWPGIDVRDVRVIPNGIDVDFWSSGRGAPEDLAGRPPVVVSVGRLHPVKGHDLLLRAMVEVREGVPAARLVVIGDGPSRGELQRLADDLGLADAVTFAGRLPPGEVRRWLGKARAFVLPSRSEGMPLSLLEAMAAGVPVVATAVGAVQDVVGPNAGVIVPSEDPASLARGLTGLLTDHGHAIRLSEGAVRRAQEFDISRMTAAYEEVFAAVREESASFSGTDRR